MIAAFELDGLPAEERTVARFAPPKPTLPQVSAWPCAAGALG